MTVQRLRKSIKQQLLLLWLLSPLSAWRDRRADEAAIARWLAHGRPAPPPHRIKAEILRQYAASYRLTILVETGTQRGAMLAMLKNDFAKLYSIELLPHHYNFARRRFQTVPQIELLHGDSAVILPHILARLQKPALFWLDGHRNPNQTSPGELVTPILTELNYLFAAPQLGHVIIIDDVRLFRKGAGYPELSSVLEIIDQNGRYDWLIQDDSLRLTPRTHQFAVAQGDQGVSIHG